MFALPALPYVAAANDAGVIVYVAPSRRAARRGTFERGTYVAVEARAPGDGCAGFFARLGPSTFVCEDDLTRAPEGTPVGGPALPLVPPGAELPHRYATVVVDGARAYATAADVWADDWFETLGERFVVAVDGIEATDTGALVRTTRARLIRVEELALLTPSHFEGVALADVQAELGQPLGVAWLVSPHRRHPRLFPLEVREVRRDVVVSVDGERLPRRRVALPLRAPRPDGVGPTERWIDVDVEAQTLVVYDGDAPIFATLVSTGGPGHETPLGLHRVWVKLARSDMNDLERDDVEHNYAIEDVPWVQYFAGDVGFHAAFWHADYGRPRSRGCVNLSPRDARRLYDLTEPHVPAGFSAMLPAPGEPATWVHVRRGLSPAVRDAESIAQPRGAP